MRPMLRIFSVLLILLMTTLAWVSLGSTMSFRTHVAANELTDDVVELWGRPMVQTPPTVELVWEEEETVTVSSSILNVVEFVSPLTVCTADATGRS